MKKILTIICLIVSFILSSITIIDGEKTTEVSLKELQSKPQIELKTHRDKDGKIKDDVWVGADLRDILIEFEISNYDQLRFTSEDNYQVRLTKQEIKEFSPIIALQRNGEELNEEKLRLVVPQIRDMFWIQGIVSITTEQENDMPVPYTLFIAEKIIEDIEIIPDPEPFKNMQGFFFIDLVAAKYPMLQGEFWLVSADGVSHKLDFEKYLRNAVIIVDEGKYNLQSPDMPGGMWIKNLAYIQMLDRAIFFKDKLNNLHNMSKLLGWKELPAVFIDQDENKIDPKLGFAEPSWENVKKVTWQN
jgi:hypothetical protein